MEKKEINLKKETQEKKKIRSLFIVFISICLLVLLSSSNNSKGKVPAEEETISSVVAGLIEGASNDEEKIKRIFYFVRDEIEFGWLYPQNIPPEEVLRARRGVCMQKANLLVSMAREAGLDARFHFMYVRKTALEDFLPGYAYKKWIDPFPHTIPEVFLNGKWVSMEATIDKELHDLCIEKRINFGKYPDIVQSVSIDFSPTGVKGHQQYVQVEGKESFYGEDLSEFTAFLHKGVPAWKRKMQPLIFKGAQKLMDKIRGN